MKEIVIDTLGADLGPSVLIEGAVRAHRDHPDCRIVLVGFKKEIEEELTKEGEDLSAYGIIDSLPLDPSVHDVMGMLRFKGKCSLTDAYNYAKENGGVAGVVSAGPTGMVLVASIRHLGLLEGVNFPCLAAKLKNVRGNPVILADCGANIEVPAEKIVTFALLGKAFASACGISSPRIGLMNVGKEDTKGDSIRKKALSILDARKEELNFVGNLEGSDLLLDKADVIACDGFSGNLLLKNTEATALICEKIVRTVGKDDPKALQAADFIHANFAYNELGGAFLLGTKKTVVKAHGAANASSIRSIVSDILDVDKGNIVMKMQEEILKAGSSVGKGV